MRSLITQYLQHRDNDEARFLNLFCFLYTGVHTQASLTVDDFDVLCVCGCRQCRTPFLSP